MIFVTIDDVDSILGSNWTTPEKKAGAVNQANVWLSTKSFCSGIDPIVQELKQAGANLAQLSANGLLFVTRTDGVVTEKTVSAQSGTSVSKKYATGQETGKTAEMQFIDALIAPFLCQGGAVNVWVCK